MAVRRGRRSQGNVAYLFLLPWLLGLALITLVPMIASLVLSFTKYHLGGTAEFVGLANYQRLFNDPNFVASAAVTAKYVVVSVPLQLAFALLIAMALNRGIRGLALYRSVYYLPSLLGTSVAVAVLWRKLFAADGLMPKVAESFGIHMGSWVADPDHALHTLMILNVWTFGAPMIIFLAGLRQIPEHYIEAAKIDGAGAWRRFISIIIPLLSPVVFFNLILQLIGSFQAFTPSYVLSSGTGGPARSTLFYTLYLFQAGFTDYTMGYASALAWVLFIVIGVFTGINFVASRYWVHYEE